MGILFNIKQRLYRAGVAAELVLSWAIPQDEADFMCRTGRHAHRPDPDNATEEFFAFHRGLGMSHRDSAMGVLMWTMRGFGYHDNAIANQLAAREGIALMRRMGDPTPFPAFLSRLQMVGEEA